MSETKATAKKFDSVALYRIRKLLSELSNKSGRGTELVTLYLPPKKPVHEAIAALREESGTASNIKSDTTRNHVQDALTKTMARLRLYNRTPENGVVIFCGAIPGPGGPGNETIELYEVLPQKPVPNYLYRCVARETSILLEDGMECSIDNLKLSWEGKRVATYNGKAGINGTAIEKYLQSRPDGRRVLKMTVESGRSIVATEDHPFYTPKGWRRLSELAVSDLLCIKPTLNACEETVEERILLEESALQTLETRPANLGLTLRRLKARGLLPLSTNNPKLVFLARLLGHLFSDGSFTHNIEIRNEKPYSHYTIDLCVGSEQDEEELRRDLLALGVKMQKGRRVGYTIAKEGRSYSASSIHIKVRDTALCTLLRTLGAPVGSKVKNGPVLPPWLLRAPRLVQREFLAAFLGGDGEAPLMKKCNAVSAVRLTYHRTKSKEREGQALAQQLEQLFKNFEIQINSIGISPGYVRKDGLSTLEFELRFKLSDANILKICQAVGYRYCQRKALAAAIAGEYIRIKTELKRKALAKLQRAQLMVAGGATFEEISSSLGLLLATSRQWALGRVKAPLIRGSVIGEFPDWAERASKGLSSGLLWESIEKIELVELDDVRDLTVADSSHSFFANGFLVHNCDDHFHLDILRDMLREQNVIGILVVDATEAGMGIVSGDIWDVVDVMSSGVSGKTRKGGQSARRYERLREMELTEYFSRVADHAKKVFLEQYQIKGLIVSGPGPTKDEFVKDKYLDYRLQNAIVGVLDTGYSGREGVRETIEKSGKLLENVRVVEERKMVQRFLREVNSDSGLAIYGIKEILAALKKAAVDIILVNDDAETYYLKASCEKCGNVVERFVQRPSLVAEKQKLLICEKCGSNEVEITERDVVDYLADASIDSGANVEVISSKTEDGAMLKSFGGIAALLRYRVS